MNLHKISRTKETCRACKRAHECTPKTHPCPSPKTASSFLKIHFRNQHRITKHPQPQPAIKLEHQLTCRIAGHPLSQEKELPHKTCDHKKLQCARETRRPCKRAYECTPKRIHDLPQKPHPPSSKTLPKLNTTTQRSRNCVPQSSFNINSRVTLQHVRFRPDKSFDARQVTCLRCSPQGRHAVPAGERMIARPNTSLTSPQTRMFPPQQKF